MFAGKKVMVIVAIFVFVLGFSLAFQSYASQAQQKQQTVDPVTQFLRQNYGVNSVEELIAKLEQQYLVKSGTDVLYSSYDAADAIQWAINHNDVYSGLKVEQYPSFGTATQLETPLETPTFEPITFNQPATVPTPVIVLQYFGFSGLGLVGLMAVPAVRKSKWLMRILVLCIIGIAAFSAGYLIGTISATQTRNIIIEPASFTETASYTISGEDTDNDGVLDIIYAKNGTTGEIEFSGTDASQVIQAAINALTSGVVFIKDGLYIINSAIIPKSNVWLVGESWNTILKLQAGASATPTESNIIYSNDELENVVIANLQLDGNKAKQTASRTVAHCWSGIYLRNQAQHIRIDHCYIHDCYVYGILIRASAGKTSYDNWVKNCKVVNNDYNDINFYAYGSGAAHYGGGIINNICGGDTGDMAISLYNVGSGVDDIVYDILIQGNIILPLTGANGSQQNPQAHIGIHLEVGSTRCKVKDNIILGAAKGIMTHPSGTGKHEIVGNTVYVKDLVLGTGSGFPIGILICNPNNIVKDNIIYIPSTVTQNAQGIRTQDNGGYNVIEGNRIYDLGSSGNSCGLRNYAGDYNVWRNNVVKGCNTPANLVGGSNRIVEGNIFDDKPCENSGTATISGGTSVSFEHGLAGTPTHVEVGWKDTGYGDWKWTANSTHITITVTNSGTYSFSWRAYYKP